MINRSTLEWSDGAAGPLLAAEDQAVPHWSELALCAQVGGDQFFPEKGESVRPAKRVCAWCEVTKECLQYALDNDERFGIWGGLSERERRRLKRKAAKPAAQDGPGLCPAGRHLMTAENTTREGKRVRCAACHRETRQRQRAADRAERTGDPTARRGPVALAYREQVAA